MQIDVIDVPVRKVALLLHGRRRSTAASSSSRSRCPSLCTRARDRDRHALTNFSHIKVCLEVDCLGYLQPRKRSTTMVRLKSGYTPSYVWNPLSLQWAYTDWSPHSVHYNPGDNPSGTPPRHAHSPRLHHGRQHVFAFTGADSG